MEATQPLPVFALSCERLVAPIFLIAVRPHVINAQRSASSCPCVELLYVAQLRFALAPHVLKNVEEYLHRLTAMYEYFSSIMRSSGVWEAIGRWTFSSTRDSFRLDPQCGNYTAGGENYDFRFLYYYNRYIALTHKIMCISNTHHNSVSTEAERISADLTNARDELVRLFGVSWSHTFDERGHRLPRLNSKYDDAVRLFEIPDLFGNSYANLTFLLDDMFPTALNTVAFPADAFSQLRPSMREAVHGCIANTVTAMAKWFTVLNGSASDGCYMHLLALNSAVALLDFYATLVFSQWMAFVRPYVLRLQNATKKDAGFADSYTGLAPRGISLSLAQSVITIVNRKLQMYVRERKVFRAWYMRHDNAGGYHFCAEQLEEYRRVMGFYADSRNQSAETDKVKGRWGTRLIPQFSIDAHQRALSGETSVVLDGILPALRGVFDNLRPRPIWQAAVFEEVSAFLTITASELVSANRLSTALSVEEEDWAFSVQTALFGTD